MKFSGGGGEGANHSSVSAIQGSTQEAVDTGSFLPVQSCMNAAKYSTSDYLARPLAYWKVNGVQWALPFAVSAPIVFYNENAFTKAGLNPADPPATQVVAPDVGPGWQQDGRQAAPTLALRVPGSGTARVPARCGRHPRVGA